MTDEKILETEKFANDMIKQNLIVSTEVLPIEQAKKLGAMALFNEKYGDIVRVVKIGKSIELCGGTHVSNTKEIDKMAINLCESKGSNVYRIEGCTNKQVEETLYNTIKPYTDEMLNLLLKAKSILDEAKKEGINLEFDADIENNKPKSYNDIIFNKNQLQYLHHEVKELEKRYKEEKEKSSLSNLDIYRENIKQIKGIPTLIMRLENKDINVLKVIADEIANEMREGFIFFANVSNNKINFISRSNSNINSGKILKKAALEAEGNGGGSPTFAQGAGKRVDKLDDILEQIKKDIENEKLLY